MVKWKRRSKWHGENYHICGSCHLRSHKRFRIVALKKVVHQLKRFYIDVGSVSNFIQLVYCWQHWISNILKYLSQTLLNNFDENLFFTKWHHDDEIYFENLFQFLCWDFSWNPCIQFELLQWCLEAKVIQCCQLKTIKIFSKLFIIASFKLSHFLKKKLVITLLQSHKFQTILIKQWTDENAHSANIFGLNYFFSRSFLLRLLLQFYWM